MSGRFLTASRRTDEEGARAGRAVMKRRRVLAEAELGDMLSRVRAFAAPIGCGRFLQGR